MSSQQGKVTVVLGDLEKVLPNEYLQYIKDVESDNYLGTRRKHWIVDGIFSLHLSGKTNAGARLILGRKSDTEYIALHYYPSQAYDEYRAFVGNYQGFRPGYRWKCHDQGKNPPEGKEASVFPSNLNGAY
jgi:hypothetical protein